jgi:hypothetical protein
MIAFRRCSGIGLALALTVSAPALPSDHIWIIGGGPNPESSQAQIEFNVNWVVSVLSTKNGGDDRKLHIYYTNGSGLGRDVVRWKKPEETKEKLQPLARVFGGLTENGNHYYEHRIPGVSGGTAANELRANLEREFAGLVPGDRALLIYNGHGYQDPDDAAGNTLRLWHDTSLSVREMDRILAKANPAVPMRFVFTQCYSGGFARLIRPEARDVASLGTSKRCGFFAESEDRESEGCSARINVGDFRDYSTYFFAALNGKTRAGEPIGVDPDRNHDGSISLFEAHLFALSQAHNADLPRSTSEVFLERWQPWYLRWADTGAEPDNEYGRMSQEVAMRNGLPPSGRQLIQALTEKRKTLSDQISARKAEMEALDQNIESMQKLIRGDVALRWPEAASPYTLNYKYFLRNDLGTAQDFIVSHPRYAELVFKQERRSEIKYEEMPNLDRDITQFDKIVRLRKLARLQWQFERTASKRDRMWFRDLKSCEDEPL